MSEESERKAMDIQKDCSSWKEACDYTSKTAFKEQQAVRNARIQCT